ncbi:histidine kinase [Pseudonocardia kujensis]|uniref:sensor histidine kinase n=1 Tax=Pseudonocardia kujensis TaxID=1128675 RepID=UPI001E6183F9|nr:histidine kinase [Pseudonocardia kujensis]MCE0765394.1 histidine kinase [Pseudonocardia kujensis]
MTIDRPLTGRLAASPTERQVRAARRFSRIGLVMTVGWLLLVPAFVLWTGLPGPAWLAALVPLYLASMLLHLIRIRRYVRSLGTPAPPAFVVPACVVGLAITLVGVASSWGGWTWALVAGVLLGDVVAGRRARVIAVWVVGSTLVVLGSTYAVGALVGPDIGGVPVSPWFAAGISTFYVAGMWCLDVERLWWFKAVTDLDDSRRTAAELATARERLRLADDLHDILGHALEVVAFKSELAARLMEADPDRARSEMDEVQRVARESLTEVRALVRSTRDTDLAVELAGARAVLGSAGVTLEVHGDPEAVAPAARNVLGRVLREAMTNVLRHAQPSSCTIEIAADRLVVCNDGVTGPGDGAGTGLVGLERYLEDHAGRLAAGCDGRGGYRLEAVLGSGR